MLACTLVKHSFPASLCTIYAASDRLPVKSTKDTEAAVGDVQMPEVYPQVIGGHVGLMVRVDRDGVDVIGVGVGKHPPRAHLHH